MLNTPVALWREKRNILALKKETIRNKIRKKSRRKIDTTQIKHSKEIERLAEDPETADMGE